MKLALQALGIAAFFAMPITAQEAITGTGAVLRGLDKVSSETTDITIRPGQTVAYGKLQITLSDCRYPSGAPARAMAYLVIEDERASVPAFTGWMDASAPALNALDHQRYDVWVLRCTTE